MGLDNITSSTDWIGRDTVVVVDRGVSVKSSKLVSGTWEDTILASAGEDIVWLESSVAGITNGENSGNYVTMLANIHTS